MTYQESVDWLFRQFPAYQNVGASAYKPDIQNISKLLDALGSPQKQLRFIHIAGTNGKGGTSHMVAAIAQAHGLKTGLFTSPHLVDFRERIKINGIQVSESEVIHWVDQLIPSLGLTYSPSFFELSFALALCYFAKEKCDLCVIETGLGGRLDATNIIVPVLSVITNIGLDHQQFLGETRPEIAYEKAGIIKNAKPVLIAEKDSETQSVFEKKALMEHSHLRWVEEMADIETDLLGKFQQINLKTAWQAFDWFCTLEGIPFQVERAQVAARQIGRMTGFRGRMELIQRDPMVLFDVAHNTHGIHVLMKEINSMNFGNLHLIFGCSGDKDLSDFPELLPKSGNLNFTTFRNSRSKSFSEWETYSLNFFPEAKIFNDPTLAYKSVLNSANANDLIVVFGSFFLIGELIEELLSSPNTGTNPSRL